MPRVKGRRLSYEAAEAKHAELMKEATEHTHQAETLANDFFSWVEEARRSRPHLPFNKRLVETFIASGVSREAANSTTEKHLDIATKYNFACGDLEKILENIRSSRFANGVKHSAGNAEPARTKVYPSISELLERTNVEHDEHLSDLELERRAFFFVLVATGNRPRHVYYARSIRLTRDKLIVGWGMRKSGKMRRGATGYPLEWTGDPCDRIAEYLKGYNKRREASDRPRKTGWIFGPKPRDLSADPKKKFNVASNIIGWIKRRPGCRQWTSTTPRDVLTTKAVKMIGTPQIRGRARYHELFDHTEKTQLEHYNAGASSSDNDSDDVNGGDTDDDDDLDI